jgi:uncharacterized protein with GYD domain
MMARYMILFSLKGETVSRFMDKPSDRSSVVRDLVSQLGGEMESYYFMLGQYDGAVVCTLPDTTSAAALAAVVTGTGAFSRYETHELISTDDMISILQKAKEISYQPPGG